MLKFQHDRGTFEFPAVADSGTTVTIISKDIASKHHMQIAKDSNRVDGTRGNEKMTCEGQVIVRINGDHMKSIRFLHHSKMTFYCL